MAIEGFPLSIQSRKINSQATIIATDFKADNGIFHKIDTLLNPYTSYFGTSSPIGGAPGPNINDVKANLEDLILADRGLDMYLNITNKVAPYRPLHYSCPPTEGRPLPLFLIPSNTAFSVLPPSSYSSLTAPSNSALSAYFLHYGKVVNITTLGNAASSSLLPRIRAANGTLALRGGTGLSVSFRGIGEKDEVMVGNARVEREMCWARGCVWVIDRLLDPLYGIFGA